jgi:hypothetical protein
MTDENTGYNKAQSGNSLHSLATAFALRAWMDATTWHGT